MKRTANINAMPKLKNRVTIVARKVVPKNPINKKSKLNLSIF